MTAGAGRVVQVMDRAIKLGFYSKERAISAEDRDKLEFAEQSVKGENSMVCKPTDVCALDAAAIHWISQRTAEQRIEERESVTKSIEAMATTFLQDGSAARWLHGSDPVIADMLAFEGVNGPVGAALAEISKLPLEM